MNPWRVTLFGQVITTKVARWETSFDAGDAVCGQCTVELADAAVLNGVVIPRVPRDTAIRIEELVDAAWVNRGEFLLEKADLNPSLRSRTATLWGRSGSARLRTPWSTIVNKQWTQATTASAIVAEMAALSGVAVSIVNDFSICQYCYVADGVAPSKVLEDLAALSGQIFWPQVDGSLIIGPEPYPPYGTADVTVAASAADVQSDSMSWPEFGNRVLVSSAGNISGVTVQVVPMSDDDACVAADGVSTVRLVAIVIGPDGQPVAAGTDVTWSASAGMLAEAVTQTGLVQRLGIAVKASDFRHVTLPWPIVSVIGVYARADVRRTRNLYALRQGSVSGTGITFGLSLDFYDQALIVEVWVAGAPNEWTAGVAPGDVTVIASAAGAQGVATLHQSNPTACPTQITIEAVPASPCLGDSVTITLKAIMFGSAGLGAVTFGLSGCGRLSSTRKTLTAHTVTETLRTSQWGGVSEVRLAAVPVEGTTPSVVLAETPGADLYLDHKGQIVRLTGEHLSGTQVAVTYVAGGTTMVAWLPTAVPGGYEQIVEWLAVTHAVVEGVTVAQVTLTRTPVADPRCEPQLLINDYFSSRDELVVTLLPEAGNPLAIGYLIECTYESVWGTQPDCRATITWRVEDGSEDGGRGSREFTAQDCREVGSGSDVPDETTADEQGEDDPEEWPELGEPDDDEPVVGCDAASINDRTPTLTADNFDAVVGVGSSDDCPGDCTCDEICTALRSKGRLATAGMMWSQCMERCVETRAAKCTSCVLSGPSTLAPGAEGTWVDGKGNSGEWSGQLSLKSRTFEGGYVATMPTGGEGPFVVKVCYGEDASSCCEAEVDFPPCTLSGPTELEPGDEGTYTPSLGMSGGSVVVSGGMESARMLPYNVGFVARMKAGECDGGTVAVSYGGRLCGPLTVDSTLKNFVGVVGGPSVMDQGEMSYFTHNLGPGAEYTGTLVLGTAGADGAMLIMPSDATGSYTASWSGGPCGQGASMTVTAIDACVERTELDAATYYKDGWEYVYSRAYEILCQPNTWAQNNGHPNSFFLTTTISNSESFSGPGNRLMIWDGNYYRYWSEMPEPTYKKYCVYILQSSTQLQECD